MQPLPPPDVLRRRIKAVIEEIGAGLGLAPEQLAGSAYLVRDLNFDSLSLVALAAQLGAEFGFEPPEDLFEDAAYQSVEEIVECCARAAERARRTRIQGSTTEVL